MTCPSCGKDNSPFETRCLRCGTRFSEAVARPETAFSRDYGTQSKPIRPFVVERQTRFSDKIPNVVMASADAASGYASGAAATARQIEFHPESSPRTVRPDAPSREQRDRTPLEVLPPPAQPSLFRPSELGAKPATLRLESRDATQGLVVPNRKRPTRKRRKSDTLPFEQGTLEFLTPTAAPAKQLATKVDASVVCDQQVASPAHRCIAGFVDGAAILIGAALLFAAFAGGLSLLDADLNLASPMVKTALVVTLVVVGLAYHAAFALMGLDTLGARFAGLRLIRLDGGTPTTLQRGLRVVAGLVSLAAGGAGFLWALLDEEMLGWHDHVSRTFPAATRQVESNFRRL